MMKVKNSLFLIWMLLLAMVFTACSAVKLPPITQAAYNGQTNEVQRLLALGAAPDTATSQGVTPLFMASLKGHEGVVRVLIDKGAGVNAAVLKTFPWEKTVTVYEGCTSLMAALAGKHMAVANLLMASGADIHAGDINGTTPLIVASALNDADMVIILIDKGADVQAKVLAPYEFKGEVVFQGTTPLLAALIKKQNANAALLVERGADVNAACDNGLTPLILAAADASGGMVSYLLANGADPQAALTADFTLKDRPVYEGFTALTVAAQGGDADAVLPLILAGAGVNAPAKYGITPLMAAATAGQFEAVKTLVAYGAAVNARTTLTLTVGKASTPKGTSALAMAAVGGFHEIVGFLIDNGAEVNAVDDEVKMDALFHAAEHGHMAVVKILVENGADVFAETKMGTAAGAAFHYCHPYVGQYIMDAREIVQMNEDED
jgi:ankyrin repeat protein